MALDINPLGFPDLDLLEGGLPHLPDFSGILAAVVHVTNQQYFREWRREFRTFVDQFQAKHESLCADLAFANNPHISQELRLIALVSAADKITEMRADLAQQIKKIDDLLCEQGGQLSPKQKETLGAIRNALVTEDAAFGRFERALDSIRGRIPRKPLSDDISTSIADFFREVDAWQSLQMAKTILQIEMFD